MRKKIDRKGVCFYVSAKFYTHMVMKSGEIGEPTIISLLTNSITWYLDQCDEGRFFPDFEDDIPGTKMIFQNISEKVYDRMQKYMADRQNILQMRLAKSKDFADKEARSKIKTKITLAGIIRKAVHYYIISKTEAK